MLTKVQVIKRFKENVLPYVRNHHEKDGRLDRPARREAWNNFTDALRSDGLISEKAYDTWSCPW